MRTSVLITGKLHATTINALMSMTDISVEYHPDCSLEVLHKHIATAQVLISRSETDIDAALLNHAPRLKVLIRAAVGVGNIDLNYATQKGMLVINTPGKNTNSAAELTLGLILAMFRKIPEAQAMVKSGGWQRHRFSGFELRGKKLGIVGLGHVGHRVAQFAKGFDMELHAYDPYISPDKFKRYHAKHHHTLEGLLRSVDILSVHVPLNQETKGMIGSKELGWLRPGAYIVNAARGGIIVEMDLVAALNRGHIAGAAIDTFESEPKPLPELINHQNVYCSPHIGASTDEAQIAIGATVVDQLQKFLEGGVVDYPVNLPELKIIDQPILKQYAVLVENLGSMMAQLLSFNPQTVKLYYRGDIAEFDHSILRLSWMKGYASQRVDDYVSYVNAAQHIENMGLKVEESGEKEFTSYKSAVKIVLQGEGKALSLGGVVFDETYKRISLVNDFYFEIEPARFMILVENRDEPGVIGHIGMELAKLGINISTFNLARNAKGGKAMAIICVDTAPDSKSLDGLRAIPMIESVHIIKL